MPFARPAWAQSLTSQLLLRSLGALLLTAILLTALELFSLHSYMELVTEHLVEEQARAISNNIALDAAGKPTAVVLRHEAQWLFSSIPSDLKYRIVDRGGNVLFSSDTGGTALAPAGSSFDPENRDFSLTMAGVALQVATVPIERAGKLEYVQVAASPRLARLTQVGAGISYLRPRLINVVLSLIVFTVVILVTLRRTLEPLREASRAAANIAPRNLAARVGTAGVPSELVPLIGAFNAALDRLETGFKLQQRFLATAAHELKTPLSLIRGQIEMGGLADKDAVLQDIDFMARQVQQLLHLAEVSEPHNYVFVLMDRAAAAGEAVRYMDRLAERHAVRLELRANEGMPPVEADRGAFFVLLKNLVENAIQHSPEGGIVRVTLDVNHLSVADEGVGIAAGNFPKLFSAFWRGSERRSEGAGLGLAICREIADAHGWKLTPSNGAVGANFDLAFAATATRPAFRSTALAVA
jgi:two-component system sensor histidine kinase QseC